MTAIPITVMPTATGPLSAYGPLVERRTTDGLEVLTYKRLSLDWRVSFFWNRDIDRGERRAFAELWGELEQHSFAKFMQPGQVDVDVAALAKDATALGMDNMWHNDVTWTRFPSEVTRSGSAPERPTTYCRTISARASIISNRSETGSLPSMRLSRNAFWGNRTCRPALCGE